MSTAAAPVETHDPYVIRFDGVDRLLHLLLIVSFLGLALTGLPLVMSEADWAGHLARAIGGYGVTGSLHRGSAVLLILVFAAHLARVGSRLVVRRDLGVLWGPRSMVPQPRDVRDLVAHVRWFLGLGPRPRFDRYTYWEKFDYLAVFWGMAIIGTSGLLLWFPAFFARFLPGWVFNVAFIVHGEEALLAVGFIFAIHFFNTHLRPEKFPMDLVIFTGRLREQDLRAERADEFDRLEAAAALPSLRVGPPDGTSIRLAATAGTIAVALGLLMLGLIFSAVLF